MPSEAATLTQADATLRWAPLSPGMPRQMVVLCHGIGGDASQLAPYVSRWAEAAPHAIFVAPCAPERHLRGWRDRLPGRNVASGHQWFSLRETSPSAQAAGARRAADWLDRFIDAELSAAGMNAAPYVIIGFSQGAMIALVAGLQRRPPPAAIISIAGAWLGDETHLAGRTDYPRVALIHGEQDTVVPVTRSVAAAAALARQAVPVSLVRCPGLGHMVDAAATDIGAKFLSQAFA